MPGRTPSPSQLEIEALDTGLEPNSGFSDARLVEDARLGDQKAFGELVRRYERRLIRVILRFVRDPDQAEDLAQESFLRVYERLDQYDASRRFGPWLFRIGVNLTLDYLRKRKRRVWGMLFTDSTREKWPDPAVADPRQSIDLHQEVWKVIEQLPEKYRIVLVLRDLENFSTSEIAAILGRREATIRWRLAEARNRFQELWEKRQRRGENGATAPAAKRESSHAAAVKNAEQRDTQ
jgi:RNA polymerase sigma-70 factor (ECF subfamily)